jgi:hemerythrin superfamily protein
VAWALQPSVTMTDETTTNALELLRSQHDQVEELIEQIEGTDDSSDKEELFMELADQVAAHATIEEKLFYPAVMTDDTHKMLVEATEEHLALKRVLADMMDLDVEDEHFDAKLKVLKDTFLHHAREEEEEVLFPQVERMMDGDELAALGNELLAMFETLIEREPRKQVPAEIEEAVELQPMY